MFANYGPTMRLRLFHQLFLLIAATVLVVVLAMAVVLERNLQRGFTDYLVTRDRDDLVLFADVAAKRLMRSGGSAALTDGRVTREALLDAFFAAKGLPPRPKPGSGRRPPPEGFGARVFLFDADHRLIATPRQYRQFPAVRGLSEPIRINGRIVAVAKLIPRSRAPDVVDSRFLASQNRGALWLAAALMALAIIPAWVLARLGVRRLGRLQAATAAIASVDFGHRVDDHGVDEIADVARNVNRMADSLAQLDSARRRWLADTSHELRTPLAAMRGELDALEDGIRPLTREAITSLNGETRRLGNLIDDLHFLAMCDLPQPAARFEPTDALELAATALMRFQPQADAAGIQLVLDSNTRDGRAVVWDAAGIERLLANLLTNSLRYTDAPGSIRLNVVVRGSDVQLTVEDSAPGVPEDQHNQLFAPLFRLDSARDRVSGGSGLGLAICEAIVHAHGGRISAATSPMGGLAIDIVLPAVAGA